MAVCDVPPPWACHLVVVELVCLSDPKSYAGGDLVSLWWVQPCRIGRGMETLHSTAAGPPGWGLGVRLIT